MGIWASFSNMLNNPRVHIIGQLCQLFWASKIPRNDPFFFGTCHLFVDFCLGSFPRSQASKGVDVFLGSCPVRFKYTPWKTGISHLEWFKSQLEIVLSAFWSCIDSVDPHPPASQVRIQWILEAYRILTLNSFHQLQFSMIWTLCQRFFPILFSNFPCSWHFPDWWLFGGAGRSSFWSSQPSRLCPTHRTGT